MAGPKMKRAQVNEDGFNKSLKLPYALRLDVFAIAMDDIYEMLHNVNTGFVDRGLLPFENSIRGAIYTGMLSDLHDRARHRPRTHPVHRRLARPAGREGLPEEHARSPRDPYRDAPL